METGRVPPSYVAPSEAARRQVGGNLGPPVVKQALVHASSDLTTRNQAKQVLRVDMRPLVIHLLAGLEQAGLERAVVVLGHQAAEIAACVQGYGFKYLQVDFVYLTIGSANGTYWRNLANSILAARAAFPSSTDPLLIVRADQLYDWRILRRIADAPFASDSRFDAYALIDVSPPILGWADGQFCSATCQRGQCHALAKVALDVHDRRRAVRCGHRLGSYDAVVAGEVYATRPRLFETLARLFVQSLSTSLADAMGELASQGTLGCVEVGEELSTKWFSSRTLAAVFRPAGTGAPRRSTPWQHLVNSARELLYSGEWRPTANMPTPPLRGELEARTEPLLRLGQKLGEGANCMVVEADGPEAEEERSLGARLAVKMFTTSHQDKGMESVMWEVHVMRQLCGHPNIVALRDTVEMADAVYLVMERIEGPDLEEHLAAQPGGRIDEATARPLFRHILAALRHAHGRGFLHCDLKPANVRLQEERDGSHTAILVDWGLARQLERQPVSLQMGTPLYASPEQLTGYNADVAWGRARLGPPADVWSLGVTLYEMLAGRPPFVGASQEALVAAALALNYELPDGWSVEARQLVDEMLQVLPSDRASVDELCHHPWTVAAEGPMPPALPTDAVLVDCGDKRGRAPSPASADVAGGRPWWRSDRARRVALYSLYAAAVVFALMHYEALHPGGAALHLVDDGADET